MRNIINYSLLSTLFLDNFILFREPFNFYFYYLLFAFFLLYYVFSGKAIRLNKVFILSLFLLTVISLLKTFINNYPHILVLKQFFAIALSSSIYYFFIKYNEYDITRLFKIYLNISWIVCLMGIIQEILFVAGYETINTLYLHRVRSIMSEPSHLAIVVSPALFISFNRWLDNTNCMITKGKSLLIILAYVLTFSGVALVGILTTALLIAKKYLVLSKKHLLFLPIIIVLSYLILVTAYKNPDIKLRIDDTWKVASADVGQLNLDPNSINLSTFALFSNYLIAREAFIRNPFFGTGIGTHTVSYDKYLNIFFPKNIYKDSYNLALELNKEDANSLGLRLLSETGAMGLSSFIIFIVLNFINFKKTSIKNYDQWLINNSIVVFFILRLLRFGNYSALGFFFFFFIYYISAEKTKAKSKFLPNHISK